MWSKKAKREQNSLWSLFGVRNISGSFLSKFFQQNFIFKSSLGNIGIKKSNAFTLVELVIVIAIIAIFFSLIIGFLDPFKQLGKAKDVQRKHDIAEMKNALDLYYNDNNCYPLSVIFGEQWKEGSTVYMSETPQDPDYPNKTYAYQIDESSTCPQWAIIYTSMNDSGGACPLTGVQDCLPSNYESNYSCSSLGSVDCEYVSSSSIVFPSPTSAPSASPTQNPDGSMPTPTPDPDGTCSKNYSCTGNPLRCNDVGVGLGNYCASNCNGGCP